MENCKISINVGDVTNSSESGFVLLTGAFLTNPKLSDVEISVVVGNAKANGSTNVEGIRLFGDDVTIKNSKLVAESGNAKSTGNSVGRSSLAGGIVFQNQNVVASIEKSTLSGKCGTADNNSGLSRDVAAAPIATLYNQPRFVTKAIFGNTEGWEVGIYQGLEGKVCKTKEHPNEPVTISQGYPITYETNGGSVVDGASAGTLPSPLPTTTRAGYTFGGWYTDSGLTTSAVAGATITAATNLYAKWTADPQTLTLQRDDNITAVTATGAAVTENPDGTYTIPTDGEVTVEATMGTDASFFRWSKVSGATIEAGDTSASASYTFKMPPGAVELKAFALGGMMAQGERDVNPFALKADCAVSVTVNGGGTPTLDLRNQQGKSVYGLIDSSGSHTASIPQDGGAYKLYADGVDTGKTITANSTTANATLNYFTYEVKPTVSGAPYAEFAGFVEVKKGEVTVGGGLSGILPEGTYELWIDGVKASDMTGVSNKVEHELKYFKATFNDGTADYGNDTLWKQQIVVNGGMVTEPMTPKKTGFGFEGWLPELDTAMTSDKQYVAQWENNEACEAVWYIDGTTTYGTLVEGLAATEGAGGGLIKLQGDNRSAKAAGTLNPNATLEIASRQAVTIDSGKTFTANGGITNNGTIDNNGSFTNSGTIENQNGTVKGGFTNSGTVNGGIIEAAVTNTGGTLKGCSLGGNITGGSVKGYTYAQNGVSFSGVDAEAATVNMQGGSAKFAGLSTEVAGVMTLATNVILREGVVLGGTFSLNGHTVKGADANGTGDGITPITAMGSSTLVVTGSGSIFGGMGSDGTNGGKGGHGIDAGSNADVVMGKNVTVQGGNGGTGTTQGGSGGCGLHGEDSFGTMTVNGSAIGGSGGAAAGSTATGGKGGSGVCASTLVNGGTISGGNGGEGRYNPDVSLDEVGIGGEAGADCVADTMKYGVIVDIDNVTIVDSVISNNAVDFKSSLTVSGETKLPQEIKVFMGGIALNGAGYTYNSQTGEITVKAPITGAILIQGVTPSTGGGGGHSKPTPPVQNGDKAPVVVDGKEYNIGNVTVEDNKTTVTVDQNELKKQLESADKSVVIPVNTATDKVTAQLVVQNVADMQDKDMILTVQTDKVSYIIPSKAVDVEAIKKILGENVNLSNAPLSITFEKSSADTVQKAQAAGKAQGFEVVGTPMDFTITATYEGKTANVNEFKAYVARDIQITAEEAKRVTTAVVYEKDGSLRHVPTFVYQRDGKYFAKVNSLTNSTYALIYNKASFADAKDKWYEATVSEMAARKVINGVGDNNYEGDRAITRAEFAAIVVRALGLPPTGMADFTDVSKDSWYSGAVATAVRYGVVKGVGENKFEPDRQITREEAMEMIYKASRVTEYSGQGANNTSKFSDYGQQSDWATAAVDFNLNNGFIVGAEGRFRPQDNIVRSEVAAVVLRLLQRSELVDVRSKV